MTASGEMMFLMERIIISTPTRMIMSAIIIVVKRSMRARYLENLWWAASFSLMMIRKPDMESVRLWMASETMARELDKRPTMMLKIASRKLVKIKR